MKIYNPILGLAIPNGFKKFLGRFQSCIVVLYSCTHHLYYTENGIQISYKNCCPEEYFEAGLQPTIEDDGATPMYYH